MTEPVRVALVGLGRWGEKLARTLGQAGLELGAVCDPRAEALARAEALYPQAARHRALDELLGEPRLAAGLAAVLIATPPIQHAEGARRAIAGGKHVFVEKPMTLSADEAFDLVARARARRRELFVGHVMLHHPAVQALSGLVARGQLGALRYLEAVRSGPGRPSSDGAGEGALWALAPHDLAVAMHLVGERPVSVAARAVSGAGDVVAISVRFAGGALLSLRVGRVQPARERRLLLLGTSGQARFDDDADAPRLAWGPLGGPLDEVTLEPGPPLVGELRHFANRVAENERSEPPLLHPCDGQMGAEVVRVLEACDRSLRRDGVPEAT